MYYMFSPQTTECKNNAYVHSKKLIFELKDDVGSDPRIVSRTPNSSRFVRQLYVSVVLVESNQV